MSDIRVRFAPSPTGYLHIGGVRTALFNYIYARQQGGKFLLRIEDTDRQRSTPEFEQEILESLKWLGLTWDEELVHQTERLARYKEVVDELLAKNLAYKFEGAIKFRMPKTQVKVYDIIRGEVVYDSNEFEDLVIVKSDGFPVFHLAVIVDDHDMGITHVIRGEDHLPNTPRHILLQQALGWKPPKYAHLPLIFGSDGTPLSKRHGAVAVTEYRKKGFLPEGLINYLALLGWNPGTPQEVFSLPELVKQFSLKRIIKSNAQFNPEKLLWVNAQHIRTILESEYEKIITDFYKEKSQTLTPEKWKKIIALYRPRIQTFSELEEQTTYILGEVEYQDEAMNNEVKGNAALLENFKKLAEVLGALDSFDDVVLLEASVKKFIEEIGLKPKDVIHPLRYVLTAKTATPGIFDLMSILGKELCLKRLNNFVS